MLKKYYCHLPLFDDNAKAVMPDINPTTPTKRVSFIEIPENVKTHDTDGSSSRSFNIEKRSSSAAELDTSINDRSVHLKMSSMVEAKDTQWPDVIKCRYYDV